MSAPWHHRMYRPELLLTLLLAVLFAGCKTSPTRYVFPRVTGTVVDSETRQPVEKARVKRLGLKQQMDPNVPPKGGEQMVQPSAVFTDQQGNFVLESIRDLTVLRKVGWYVASITIDASGYQGMVTNFTPANATNTLKGEPVVEAGVIPLVRVPK